MSNSCIVVGAGMAGLMAATNLHQSGVSCLIFEAHSQAGGRMIPWQNDNYRRPRAVYDLGAQFFTVRNSRFAQYVSSWIEQGVVDEWSHGFATADGSYYADGHPRYRGSPNMGAVAQNLTNELDVRFNSPIKAIKGASSGWQVIDTKGNSHDSQALIMTPPVPQSLALLEAGGVHLPSAAIRVLKNISYEPCIALCIQLAKGGNVPKPGGMWAIGEPIAWIADNYQKGVSPVPGAITIHAGSDFSQNNWQLSDSEVADQLLAAAEEWLVDKVEYYYVHRWPFSKPLWLHADPIYGLFDQAPLVFAGDAFAGPRVEGAALSGLAAADRLLKLFGKSP